MKTTVFFSWQSDRPSKESRNFIEQSLKDAIARLISDATVEEAIRDGLELDKDTKGVPGSPSIMDTIFSKIDNAAVFVADLTFVGARSRDGLTPNPNVLIEYGWALKSLGRSRIIGVMNEAHGAPDGKLPFDLAHLRHPITYNLPEGASAEERRTQKERLTNTLESALRLILTSEELQASLPKAPEPPAFAAHESFEDESRFRNLRQPLGYTWSDMPGQQTENQEVVLHNKPAMWLRVMPVYDPDKIWTATELRAAAQSGGQHLLMPFCDSVLHHLRAEDGFGVFSLDRNFNGKVETRSVTFAFDTGEVWSVDTAYLGFQPDKLFLESIVKAYTSALKDYGEFLQRLGITGPFQWIAGLIGVKKRRLAVPPPAGHINIHRGQECLGDPIIQSGTYDPAQDAKKSLQPFFDLVCRKCGRSYPDYPPFA